jgi:hypothetical protein
MSAGGTATFTETEDGMREDVLRIMITTDNHLVRSCCRSVPT